MSRLRITACVVAVFAAMLLSAPATRADGDPASDVLIFQRVFIPSEAPVSLPIAARLFGVVNVATANHYGIRVAVIGSPRDMGSVSALWGKPRTYARFLGEELKFAYRGRLLVVMPNGFGITRAGKPDAQEQGGLRHVAVRQGADALVASAAEAVSALARTSGATLDPAEVDRATARALKTLTARRQASQTQTVSHARPDNRDDDFAGRVILGVLALGLAVAGAGLRWVLRKPPAAS